MQGWGAGSFQKDLFPHPQLEARPLGPGEGEGDAGGRGKSHMATALHWAEDKGARTGVEHMTNTWARELE